MLLVNDRRVEEVSVCKHRGTEHTSLLLDKKAFTTIATYPLNAIPSGCMIESDTPTRIRDLSTTVRLSCTQMVFTAILNTRQLGWDRIRLWSYRRLFQQYAQSHAHIHVEMHHHSIHIEARADTPSQTIAAGLDTLFDQFTGIHETVLKELSALPVPAMLLTDQYTVFIEGIDAAAVATHVRSFLNATPTEPDESSMPMIQGSKQW